MDCFACARSNDGVDGVSMEAAGTDKNYARMAEARSAIAFMTASRTPGS